VKRALLTLLLVAGIGVAYIASTGAGSDPDKGKYWVQFDNAFGLIQGGDLKVAGVRAGKITDIRLDKRTKHALIGFKIDKNGFGSLRTDAFCESRPQSLIGEYFVDCQPGTAKRELKPGATIPVGRTASTVPPDLVNDILRRPYRERLSLIIGSLGAGVAGNADNLNAAIRRASPALRETDKVLAMLGRQNKVLADLTVNANKVVGDLAANRKDVGRFVTEAKETAQASAERRGNIAAGFRELPGFLEELQPTMKALGQVADDQRSALQNLDASSQQLTTFFDQLGPFADASRPAFRSLGQASKTGDRAVKAAPPVIAQLGAFAAGTPELGKNLAIVLQHLDDRKHAVEKDPRSPGGQGYTGLEALLQYAYDQTTSTSIFDQNNHILKIGAFVGPCADYASEETLKKDPALEQQCGSRLGPIQPGLNYPDVTRRATPDDAKERGARKRAEGDHDLPLPAAPVPPDNLAPSAPAAPATPATPSVPSAPTPSTPTVPTPTVPGVPPIELPPLPGTGGGNDRGGGTTSPLPPLPKLSANTSSDPQAKTKLLDYLLGR
jgi:phospholipid/cholesterol/gamma-HCH transport system substrate-binding protein